MAVNLAGIRRNVKNVTHNYTDAQIKVREATSNDPWGPSSTMMSEIADLTYSVAFSEIMAMIWKRLNDHGRNWRHVYKALVLLEYLIKTGSDKVAQQCKENIYAIQTLKDFQYLDDNKDQGINVREKAKALVALLKDDEKLKNERVRALKAKERFAQSASGIGGDIVYNSARERHETHRGTVGGFGGSPTGFEVASDLEAARPQTAGEEELQLQLALAMSREEQEQEDSKNKSDDMRLQLALQKSRQEKNREEQQQTKAQDEKKPSSDLLDLDIGFGNPVQQPPPPARTTASGSNLDPWGMEVKPANNDPWGGGGGGGGNVNDPWSPVNSQNKSRASPTAMAMASSFPSQAGRNDPWLPVGSSHDHNEPSNQPDVFGSNNSGRLEMPGPSRPVNDPWTLADSGVTDSGNVDTRVPNDPFSPLAQSQLAEFDLLRKEMESRPNEAPPSCSGLANSTGTVSPNPFDLDALKTGLKNGEESTGAIPKNSVQSLLGEHSNLVNLDDLVTSGKSHVRNPFDHQPPNPFQAAKTPKPAMNELLQQKTATGWTQGQPTNQPGQQLDFNPFF